MYIADSVDGEVAGEGYGLYEDELNEQDNYLNDVGELKDESSGSRSFWLGEWRAIINYDVRQELVKFAKHSSTPN